MGISTKMKVGAIQIGAVVVLVAGVAGAAVSGNGPGRGDDHRQNVSSSIEKVGTTSTRATGSTVKGKKAEVENEGTEIEVEHGSTTEVEHNRNGGQEATNGQATSSTMDDDKDDNDDGPDHEANENETERHGGSTSTTMRSSGSGSGSGSGSTSTTKVEDRGGHGGSGSGHGGHGGDD